MGCPVVYRDTFLLGGILSLEDMANYKSIWADTVSVKLDSVNLTVHSVPPPGSGTCADFHCSALNCILYLLLVQELVLMFTVQPWNEPCTSSWFRYLYIILILFHLIRICTGSHLEYHGPVPWTPGTVPVTIGIKDQAMRKLCCMCDKTNERTDKQTKDFRICWVMSGIVYRDNDSSAKKDFQNFAIKPEVEK